MTVRGDTSPRGDGTALVETPPGSLAVRADAQRNRARVLTAARAAFAAHGTGLSLADVARRAGLAAGTVHRHFPSKDALLEAVLAAHTDDLLARASRRAAGEVPGDALFVFLEEIVEGAAPVQGRCAGLVTDRDWPRPTLDAATRRFELAIASFVAVARRAGAVRDTVTTREVRTVLVGATMMLAADPDARPTVRRVLRTLGPEPVTEHTRFRDGRECSVCGTPLPTAPVGRPAEYCGARCRQRAHRRRSATTPGRPTP